LQAKYHKVDGSERSSQSENGDLKPATSSQRQHSIKRLSAQHSLSQDGSSSSAKDHENDSDDLKPKRKKSTKHGSSRDLAHGGEPDGKPAVGKSRARHKSFDVQRSKMTSGPPSTADLAESQPHGTKSAAAATENSGLLSVSAANADVTMSRSHQDLTTGNYLRLSPRPSSSRLSSHADLRGFDPTHRRTTNAVSASTSVGSGLDDDDYIDPHRDVGVAVCIRDGYFSWLPRANGEALMSDVNFVADAGWFDELSCLSGFQHLLESSGIFL